MQQQNQLQVTKRKDVQQQQLNEVYGNGTALRGVDLVEQVARNAKLQRQRWMEIYKRLWDAKVKLDIADTILITNGTLQDWYYTSSLTGEMQRKQDSKLNPITIKKDFVKKSDPTIISRQIAVLFHEESVTGNTTYSVLSDLEFNVVLGHPTSLLWKASFLLQPFLPAAKQHPQCRGTFVAKYNASTTSRCIRVLQIDSLFHELNQANNDSSIVADGHKSSSSTQTNKKSYAGATIDKREDRTKKSMTDGLQEIIERELQTLVGHIETAFRDRLRLLHAEFHITNTHRLMLIRISSIVFFSDYKIKSTQERGKDKNTKSKIARPSSVLLSEEESQYLKSFGAHAEATLVVSRAPTPHSAASSSDAHLPSIKLLQRRIFMLQSTLWNPKSEAFSIKTMELFETAEKFPQKYEMVRVCRPCYLIYHTIDNARLQAIKSTKKAAVRRATAIYNAKLCASIDDFAVTIVSSTNRNRLAAAMAWQAEHNEIDAMDA